MKPWNMLKSRVNTGKYQTKKVAVREYTDAAYSRNYSDCTMPSPRS